MANEIQWLVPRVWTISDSFSTATDIDLSSHTTDQGYAWAKWGGAGAVVNDVAASGLATDATYSGNVPFYYINHTFPSADYQVQVTANYPGTDAVVACIGMRYNGGDVSTNSQSLYLIAWFPDIATARLLKSVLGVLTQLGSDLITSGNTQTLLISAVGSTITGSANGVQIASVTDTDIASAGFIAMTGLTQGRYGSLNGHMTYDTLLAI